MILGLSSRCGRLACLVLAGAAVFGACAGRPQSRVLVLATTTSVGNSGLLDVLVPAFNQQHDIDVRSHLVGSGRALQMLESGYADVVISHAPAAETAALGTHSTWRYRKVMFNDFVIAGPPADPAQLKGAVDARDAMRRIAASDAKFISRGDRSGTHEREEALWQAAGVRPPGQRLIVAGAGMGATLRIASETAAYTLADRATFAQLIDSLRLVVAFEGDRQLLNTYSIVYDSAGSKPGDAEEFFRWLADGEGRRLVETYRIRGVAAFEVWPSNRPAHHPDALPR